MLSALPSTRLPYFTRKHFEAIALLRSRPIHLRIRTPDLRWTRKDVWGDLGPTYTCCLEPHEMVEVMYRCPKTGRQVETRFSPPAVAIMSTPSRRLRRRLPFRLEIEDAARGLRVLAYMSPDGQVCKVDLEVMASLSEPYNLIFGAEVEASSFGHAA